MQAPDFWYSETGGWRAIALTPLVPVWRLGGAVRTLTKAAALPGPCFCIGNAVVGGSGKTPTVQALARLLHQTGKSPGIVLAGYGGSFRGPVRVDTERHSAQEVGDEALLHATLLPTFVARDRVLGAQEAFKTGCNAVIFDDGFQNPALANAKKILVIDGESGIGNGRVMPAGPLREPFKAALKRADAVLLLDEDRYNLAASIPKTVARFRARRTVQVAPELYFKPVVAFAGIAHPTRFFASLAKKGVQLAATKGFPDHHQFSGAQLDYLRELAIAKGARLVTTAKDWVRLPASRRPDCTVIGLDLEASDADTEALRRWALSAFA